MPMKMGIHSACWFIHSAFLDSRLRGNDEFWGTSFSEGSTVMPMKMGIHRKLLGSLVSLPGFPPSRE